MRSVSTTAPSAAIWCIRAENPNCSRSSPRNNLPTRRAPRWLRGRKRWVTIPVLAAAAAAVFVLARPPAGEPSTPRDLESSRVVSGPAPSSVSFGDAHIELAANTAIVMDTEQGAPSVLVERGTASFNVAPRAARPPFVVRAGDTTIRVVGTQFEVARFEERISVAVEHGIVDVQFRGRVHRVTAGGRWASEPAETTAVVEPSPTAPPEPEPEPEPEPVAPTSPARTTTSPPATTTAAKPSHARPTVDADRLTYERLAAAESRDAGAAIAGYLELSKGSSKWSAVALYAAARLAADRDDPRAVTFLQIYLRRFPSGANAEDARRLLERIKETTR